MLLISKVAALFVQRDGAYWGLPGVDCWDEQRDARNYGWCSSVVAHPPCHLWVNLAAVNWKRYGRQLPAWYPGGTDGGCFESALKNVRQCGGVLEHPAFTHAWAHYELEPPGVRWKQSGPGEWVCEVWQSAYGHRARKRTWLLYAGKRPPFELRWQRVPGTHQVGHFDKIKPVLSPREANATPIEFRDELLRLARWSKG